MLTRLEEPYKLIIETCIATGARISEVLGLKWKHVNLEAATIKIEQRVWRQDVGRPKSEDSRRTLGIGDLAQRFREKAIPDSATPEAWLFGQKRSLEKPLWDSGVRDAFMKPPGPKAATSPASGRIPSVEPTSPGGNKSAAARSRPRKSPGIATSR